MKKTLCDKCRKELEDSKTITVGYWDELNCSQPFKHGEKYKFLDYCEECYKAFWKNLKDFNN